MVNCPLCDAALDVDEDELDEGDELTCEECAATIRVTSKEPLELEAAEEEDEDYDDEDEEEEDEFDEGEDGDELEEEESEDEDWR